jgi:hypothetical protein
MTVKELSESAALSDPALALVREESTPTSFLEELEKKELFQDAIRFLAFKLPTDTGIKWASACVRDLRSPENKEKDEPLDAADQWIKTPGDPTRWAAKNASDKSKKNGASNLVAMAVFLSGGSLAPAGAPMTPPPKYAAQKLIAGSIQVAVVGYEPAKASERYRKALAKGKALDAPGA